jgi:hypothetical protein
MATAPGNPGAVVYHQNKEKLDARHDYSRDPVGPDIADRMLRDDFGHSA